MKSVILPAARTDILEQHEYLFDVAGERVAQRFLDAVQRAVERIMATPDAGPPRLIDNPRLRNLRTWSVDGFDDVKVYYIAAAQTLTIVRVLSGRRDVEGLLRS